MPLRKEIPRVVVVAADEQFRAAIRALPPACRPLVARLIDALHVPAPLPMPERRRRRGAALLPFVPARRKRPGGGSSDT